MENYKFFNDPYKFSGKHARMVSELWSLNDYEHSYFKRLIDIYIVAAILGFRIDRKAKRDYAPVEQRTVFGEQMRQASEDLEFILQMMLLLEPAGQGIHEECIRRAFKGVETEEEFKRYNELFESYMLGGVDELYERLVLQKEEIDTDYSDDKTANLMMLFERFAPKKNS